MTSAQVFQSRSLYPLSSLHQQSKKLLRYQIPVNVYDFDNCAKNKSSYYIREETETNILFIRKFSFCIWSTKKRLFHLLCLCCIKSTNCFTILRSDVLSSPLAHTQFSGQILLPYVLIRQCSISHSKFPKCSRKKKNNNSLSTMVRLVVCHIVMFI